MAFIARNGSVSSEGSDALRDWLFPPLSPCGSKTFLTASRVSALMVDYVATYKAKRDKLIDGLKDHYEIVKPGGAFYVFPKLPWGTGAEFIDAAIENKLMVIPGNIFSDFDTHFRISYAASDETIERGVETLCRIAESRVAT